MMTKSKTTVTAFLEKRRKSPSELIEILQDIQASYNHLPEKILRQLALELDVPLIEVFCVAIFTRHLR
jgi:NADH:ubiquinone oxidoreductase subunit E